MKKPSMFSVAIDFVFFTKAEAERARKALENVCKQKCTIMEFEFLPKRKVKGKKK